MPSGHVSHVGGWTLYFVVMSHIQVGGFVPSGRVSHAAPCTLLPCLTLLQLDFDIISTFDINISQIHKVPVLVFCTNLMVDFPDMFTTPCQVLLMFYSSAL